MVEIKHATTTGPIDEPQWNEAHIITGLATVASTGAYGDLTGIPSTFTPAAHNHVIADVAGLQAALDGKQPLTAVLSATTASFTTAQESKLAGIAAGATANQSDAFLISRANHTGEQAITTVTGLQAALDGKQPLSTVLTNTTASFTTALLTKLNGIATGATANATDAQLRDRSTHTGTQAISTVTGLQAALDGKQATLVSGSNIKTVGGVSVLGSGDIPISGGSGDVVGPASSTNDALAAFDGITGKLLKAGTITLAQAIALRDEVIAARGDRASLGLRIDAIADISSPNAGGVVVGRYYDQALQASNGATSAGAADRVEMSPFITSQRLRIDQIGVAVSTAVAGSLMKCFIYASGANGWPDQLVYEAPTDLSGDATVYVAHSLDFSFDNGRKYWIGVRWTANTTIRAIPIASMGNLGLQSAAAAAYNTQLRDTIAFATPMPAIWTFAEAQLATGNPPSIRMRAIAL